MLFYVLTRLITDGLIRVHAAGQGYLTDWGVSSCPGNCCWLGYKPLAGVLAEGESLAGLGDELRQWRESLADQGWGAPTWPREYGGAGLTHPQVKVLNQEIRRLVRSTRSR